MHRPWLVFTISCSLFFLSQFYRVSNAVIAPQLLSDLSVDTKGLGLISASFFYAFALTQIPISKSLSLRKCPVRPLFVWDLGFVIWNLNNFLIVVGLNNFNPINVSKSPCKFTAPSSAFTHKIRNVGRCQANIAFAGVDLDRGPFRDYLY